MQTVRLLVLLALTGAFMAQADDQRFVKDGRLDVTAVVAHFEDLYRSESSEADVELTVTKPRRTRTLRMQVWTKGRERVLIVITAPPREKGTATLKVERNLWNFLPRIKRTIRIPPSMMLASWMGSDFTNDDLVREASFLEDYTYALVGPSEAPPGWLIRFTARPEVPGLWSRFDLVVDAQDCLPLYAEYYDRRGELARTVNWSEPRVFDNRKLPTRMTLVPVDKPGHQTEMVYRDLKFGAEMPDEMFSLSELERQR